MDRTTDLVVIGAGPAGYAAAIRCAQLGFKTICIDKSVDAQRKPTLGGTCLNWGCIPSKALLDISQKFKDTKEYAEIGIGVSEPTMDVSQMMAFKDSVVKRLTGGIQTLFTGNGVTFLPGIGQLGHGKQVSYRGHDGTSELIDAKHVILAPGSVPMEISAAPLDNEFIVDSTGALEFDKVPKKLGIIGAGIIGLELGSVWRRLGSEVVILEALDDFLPMVDRRIARDALRIFKQQGLDIRLGARVVGTEVSNGSVSVNYQLKGEDQTYACDKIIVAVGRRPYTEGLLSEGSAIKADERGSLFVNDLCSTSAPDIYAVGDVVRGPKLAHKGMEEGVMVAERIAGHKPLVNYDTVPSVIYTHPEIAWVGETESEIQAMGDEFKSGMFSYAANGRAIAANDTDGMVKIIADKATDRVRGIHIIGSQASELIAQGVIAMEFGATAEDLALTMFAHPSLSESVHEAALGVNGNAIHAVNRRKSSK